jgi:hypothetical protein
LIEVNEGSPILHEVLAYMHERDFVALDLLELHRCPVDRALLQVDILFATETPNCGRTRPFDEPFRDRLGELMGANL